MTRKPVPLSVWIAVYSAALVVVWLDVFVWRAT